MWPPAFPSPSGWYHQVENLTDCISINHNWCNSVNLPSLYDSMCAKVLEVEHALEDVREMLESNQATSGSANPGPDGWRAEWVAIVQDVVEKDAGWKCVLIYPFACIACVKGMAHLCLPHSWSTFWKMVRHAICLAMDRPCMAEGRLWPRTPRELMPPLDFIASRVRTCLQDFVGRPERELHLVPGLEEVVADVRKLLVGE